MDGNKDTGYILLAIGIAILAVTLYTAYSFYSQAINGTLFTSAKTGGSTTIPQFNGTGNATQKIQSALIASITAQLSSTLPILEYSNLIFAVILLGVFASIGYKLSMLGINMLRVDKPPKSSER